MSNYVFPTSFPGFGIKIDREPYTKVSTLETSSGREFRSTLWTMPRYRYRLSLDGLRSTSTEMEFQGLLNFWIHHFGQLGSFLLEDPDDCSVTNHCFGIGDGATTTFQLQRCFTGLVYDNMGVPWVVTDRPRTNYCLYSEDMNDGAWETSTCIVPGDFKQAPDGSFVAVEFSTSGGIGFVRQEIAGVLTGTSCIFSIWAKCVAGTTVKIGLIDDGYAEYNGPSETLNSTWKRIDYSVDVSSILSPEDMRVVVGADGSWADGVSIELWGASFEYDTPSPTEYIKTTSAAVTVDPVFWPGASTFFEPITDINPYCLIYIDDVLQQPDDSYTIDDYGVVTFDLAPGDGAILTWTGNYYRRVRFAQEGLSTQRIVQQLWSSSGLQLISVTRQS